MFPLSELGTPGVGVLRQPKLSELVNWLWRHWIFGFNEMSSHRGSSSGPVRIAYRTVIAQTNLHLQRAPLANSRSFVSSLPNKPVYSSYSLAWFTGSLLWYLPLSQEQSHLHFYQIASKEPPDSHAPLYCEIAHCDIFQWVPVQGW